MQNDSYQKLEKISNSGFDIFKEHSGVIFSVKFNLIKCYTVQFVLPNVTDCQLRDQYHHVFLKKRREYCYRFSPFVYYAISSSTIGQNPTKFCV